MGLLDEKDIEKPTRSVWSLSEITDIEPNRDMGDLSELKESIKTLGLINPITIDKTGRLLAGKRRFAAMKELGWDECPVYSIDESAFDVFYSTINIEFKKKKGFDAPREKILKIYVLKIGGDENLRRKALTTSENRKYIVTFIREMQGLYDAAPTTGGRPQKTVSKADSYGYSVRDGADDIGINRTSASEAVQAEEFVEQNKELDSLNLSTTEILEIKKAPRVKEITKDLKEKKIAGN